MDVHFLPLVSQIETRLNSMNVINDTENESGAKNEKVNLKNVNSFTTVKHIYISSPPRDLKSEFNELLTDTAIQFLVDLATKFDEQVDNLYNNRLRRKANLKIPTFRKPKVVESDWKVASVTNRLKNRHLDLGDVSPSNLNHLCAALRADVQGIQVDFDDGHCPNWFNQISGLHNVLKVVQNRLQNVPKINSAPILMMRPRAWNMIEKHVNINGKNVPGAIFDFALLIFHTGKILQKHNCGPCFYLSKIENSDEAKLWNEIFTWSEMKLAIPHGTIKACVLIENILACFEVERILYELKDHSLGLNCGIWDYAASIIAKFGDNKDFLIPDRCKYVNINQRFLKKYLQLVVKTCHKRGAHATSGMAAQLLAKNQNSEAYRLTLKNVCDAKISEIQEGVDGFMVYDINLVSSINHLWSKYSIISGPNQISYVGYPGHITEDDLLSIPNGGVTIAGLKRNISVTVLFIYNWLSGTGHFMLEDCVEDSATAEISRSQIWQWIRHSAQLEDSMTDNNNDCNIESYNNNNIITKQLVMNYTDEIVNNIMKNFSRQLDTNAFNKLFAAKDLFTELISARNFPDFITTYIYNSYPFSHIQSRL